MKEIIYLIVDRNGVQGMRKSLVDVKRGQAIVKLNVTMPADAFDPPVLVQDVVINNWRAGIDMEDVEFKNPVITEDEAEMVKKRRLEKMKSILEDQGYIIKHQDDDDESELDEEIVQ